MKPRYKDISLLRTRTEEPENGIRLKPACDLAERPKLNRAAAGILSK